MKLKSFVDSEQVKMPSSIKNDVQFRFLSLGSDCQPAWQISQHKPNRVAHLFDWLATPIQQTIKLIEADFENFLNPVNLHPYYIENRLQVVVDTYYRIDFTHDFATFDSDDIALVRNLYLMKVRWFREILDDKDDIPTYFVRRWDRRDGPENEDSARELYQLLKKRRRDIRFLYLHNDPSRPPIKEGGYRSCYLHPPLHFRWAGDDATWRRILTKFAMEPGPDDVDTFKLPPLKTPRFSIAAS